MKENQIAEEIFAKLDTIIKTQSDLTLTIQSLEKRVQDLENGEFGTGLYLDGCNDLDREFITNKNKKAGE